MAPQNVGFGGSSHQRKVATKAEKRIADEAAKKVLQRIETNVTNPSYPPIAAESHSFRAHVAAFWGSTPVWGAVGVLIGALASQISLKLLFVGVWVVLLMEFVRVGFLKIVLLR